MDPNDKTADVLGLGGLTEASMGSEAQPQNFNEGQDYEPSMGMEADAAVDQNDGSLAMQQLQVQPDMWHEFEPLLKSGAISPNVMIQALQQMQQGPRQNPSQGPRQSQLAEKNNVGKQVMLTIGKVLLHRQMKNEVAKQWGRNIAKAIISGHGKGKGGDKKDAYQEGSWYDLDAQGDKWFIIPHEGLRAGERIAVKPDSDKDQIDSQAYDYTYGLDPEGNVDSSAIVDRPGANGSSERRGSK